MEKKALVVVGYIIIIGDIIQVLEKSVFIVGYVPIIGDIIQVLEKQALVIGYILIIRDEFLNHLKENLINSKVEKYLHIY